MKTLLTSRNTLIILLVLHLVGMMGIMLGFEGLILPLTPIHLLVSTTLILAHQKLNTSMIIFLAGAWSLGFGMEWLGVHTGKIFGAYEYGATLGLKLDEIPLIIGVNWIMLVIASASVVGSIPLSWWQRSILGAALMVGLDVLIEPVAVKYDFWTWYGEPIPLQNYLAWGGIALVMHLWLNGMTSFKPNKVAIGLFLFQVLFFGGLLIYLNLS